ncbi:2-polyprenyl-3-methyl-6-methoxy-1,4-benzoquinone monooxygenase [Gammaproteobacteria bacterium]|jgi:ubiquinone biosynthesis monooxygenase Coq7|nr:2-polyprenyl-3-methyl-6-methoxy-1,4-benzoquinone monooxygenase [SAR86 cluster bacterium]MDA8526360.1 2-polyprenyl-3-methyl-6-methoxy-1,4-benzoquinone monooxygenase [Gammaproteobacteria bacterium]MDA8709641.1 2-polyprenyl-3-methyl-6-methoxy-1,4-benzoquinone monooxygenase [Gammaproteobacteria bacterium]MDA8798742.1 2-polyprenyl-3-methyl-6-methoxy-1,4-benzoquinone monooxygenase [Gammaproteobacteria bacterium]MDA9140648.1 2-polyprenyl-3-methyl-6-methoxy-1,4-benzoquinone monooxygenase [Gammaprote
MNLLDNFVNECDIALKTLSFKKSGTGRSYPSNQTPAKLSKKEKNLSAQLMRINLAGEVAAQALYRGQAMVCKDAEIKAHLVRAGEEETDHLIWCKKRLEDLNGKPSILNPVWYAGSFAIGAIFGSLGEKTSLGFVEETEKQVVKHLERHLDKVSKNDVETIEILKTMRADEDEHAQEASENGGESLSAPTKKIMSLSAKVMTSSSAYI